MRDEKAVIVLVVLFVLVVLDVLDVLNVLVVLVVLDVGDEDEDEGDGRGWVLDVERKVLDEGEEVEEMEEVVEDEVGVCETQRIWPTERSQLLSREGLKASSCASVMPNFV
jgi:hypothetical protein